MFGVQSGTAFHAEIPNGTKKEFRYPLQRFEARPKKFKKKEKKNHSEKGDGGWD